MTALLDSSAGKQWAKIGIQHHHGINLPLSALHSKNSCGIGEFFDLIPLINWCSELKLDLIQLLPLNDSGNDPSPFNNLSSCALNPVFLSLHALPFLDEFPELKKRLTSLQELTKSQHIAYHAVKIQKLYWLRLYFFYASAKVVKSDGYSCFLEENSWVVPYGMFKVIKDVLEQSLWLYWPDDLKYLSKTRYEELVKRHLEEISFYTFVQYLCSEQLKAVKKCAEEAHVLLKGDVPILISLDSVDVWHHPEFFNLEYVAGAPPDVFSDQQQYWGFPIYRWEVKKKAEYSWWKQRLHVASRFFDLYRLDHVIGLFRIWAIPAGQPKVQGHYIPQDESLWIPQGKDVLEMMLSTFPMMPIAEDLGQVQPAIRHCLTELGIPGTKVMRWERDWNGDKKFIPYEKYSPISMTCVSTHDSETLALWWRDKPDEARAFAEFKGWQYTPELYPEQRQEILWDSHHTGSLFHINLLGEYLALFPDLVWSDLHDERINVPGQLLPTNWTYRFRGSIEEITAHESLRKAMEEILAEPLRAKKSA